MNDKSEYADILDSVKKLAAPEIMTVTNGERSAEVMVIPEGKRVEGIKPYLDQYLTAPERRTGTANVTQLNSFIAHVNRFKDADSVIFANDDIKNPSLTAIIDYHKQTYAGEPRFGEHRTHYKFPLSKEWQAWFKMDGEPMEQSEFAAFIEDRIGDVMPPLEGKEHPDKKIAELVKVLGGNFAGASTLVALSRTLKVNESAKVKASTNLSTGEGSIVYETEHRDDQGAPLKVPNMFMIAVPLFVGGSCYSIAVRLRYRVRLGAITWFYNLYRVENVFEDAFNGACKQVEKETELPVFLGSDENSKY